MSKKIIYLIARGIAALLMLQTLYFKFTGSPESMYIFETIGFEPEGRWIIGFMELIASVLLIVPRSAWLGGLLGVGLMVGAMGIHLTKLGIEVMDDNGSLFIFALATFICCSYVVVVNKKKIINEVVPKIFAKK